MSRNEHDEYACGMCDYTTSRLNNYRRHILTPKHQMVTNGNMNEQPHGVVCPDCHKIYRHRSGLSRHRRACKGGNNAMHEILESIVHDQGVIKDKLEDLAKHPSSVTLSPKKMTMNVFLDVACKDAMNFGDFVDRISVTMSDLAYSRENGYAEGIGNILNRALEGVSPLDRPIHCSDKKRLVFYVKDDDAWQRDGREKIAGSLELITQKQVHQIKRWERENEGWEGNDRKVGEWMAVVRNVMGDSEPQQREADKTQVLRTITGTTELKGAMDTIGI
jgi:hypothetical protein